MRPRLDGLARQGGTGSPPFDVIGRGHMLEVLKGEGRCAGEEMGGRVGEQVGLEV